MNLKLKTKQIHRILPVILILAANNASAVNSADVIKVCQSNAYSTIMSAIGGFNGLEKDADSSISYVTNLNYGDTYEAVTGANMNWSKISIDDVSASKILDMGQNACDTAKKITPDMLKLTGVSDTDAQKVSAVTAKFCSAVQKVSSIQQRVNDIKEVINNPYTLASANNSTDHDYKGTTEQPMSVIPSVNSGQCRKYYETI